DSYRFILDKVLSAVRGLGVRAEFRPVCDLVLVPGEKKFSGNAQRRGKTFFLHHGTLLYAFDLERISRYLKMPPQMPDYRKSRSHQDFISNIPVSPQEIRQALARTFA
ncbi:MAG: lipoate--protein ligase family protein, partial [Elusimicrobia bacterium]|nr:lipoate--protein ligase family protein [Elusimicrobiota bacterium]